MQRSSAQLMLIVLVVGLLLMRESRQNPGALIESSFVDWLAANTSRSVPTAPLTLVEINDSSMADKHPWPWSPLDFALFLQAVLQFDPSVVAIEHILFWDERQASPDEKLKRPQFEKILHDYLLRAPKVLLAAQLGFPEDPDVVPPIQPVPVLRHLQGSQRAIPEFTTVERQPKEEFRLQTTPGFVNLGAQSIARTVPLIFRYRGQVVPSFVLQAMILWFRLTPDDVKVEVGSRIVLGDKVTIPIDDSGNMRVDFKSPYTRFGFDDLLLGVEMAQTSHPTAITAATVKNKLVLLARTDRASRTLSFPTRHSGSSGELFAAAIATIQNRTFIRRIPPVFDVAVLAVIIALSYFFAKWETSRVLLVSSLSLILYPLFCMTIFGVWFIWLPFLMPAGTLLFVVLFRLLSPNRVPA